jgi:protein TonB
MPNTAKVVPMPERRRESLGASARKLQRPTLALPVFGPFMVPASLAIGSAISVFIHAVVVFGINFKLPDPRNLKAPSTTLDVVLVNSKSASRPVKADALAQANLDGGGNTDEARRAKTPLPVTPRQNDRTDDANLARKIKEMEQQAQRLLTSMKAKQKVEKPVTEGVVTEKPQEQAPEDLVEKSMQMARLEAQIARSMEVYQQRPKRQFIGARAQEFRFATYVDQWRQKIERIGNLNYPEEAKIHKIYGRLQLTVAIRADGSVERVDINHSSGHKVLDEAAKRIVFLASPYAQFPDEIRKDTDILEITRTWTFTREDQVSAE